MEMPPTVAPGDEIMSHALETFENGQTAFAPARGARAVFAPGNKQKAFSVFGALAGV